MKGLRIGALAAYSGSHELQGELIRRTEVPCQIDSAHTELEAGGLWEVEAGDTANALGSQGKKMARRSRGEQELTAEEAGGRYGPIDGGVLRSRPDGEGKRALLRMVVEWPIAEDLRAGFVLIRAQHDDAR